jgi:hypothetical protein
VAAARSGAAEPMLTLCGLAGQEAFRVVDGPAADDGERRGEVGDICPGPLRLKHPIPRPEPATTAALFVLRIRVRQAMVAASGRCR